MRASYLTSRYLPIARLGALMSFRQKEELHGDFYRSPIRLQEEEQILLARKMELDEIIRQEVDR